MNGSEQFGVGDLIAAWKTAREYERRDPIPRTQQQFTGYSEIGRYLESTEIPSFHNVVAKTDPRFLDQVNISS
jgi:hypothetical protein